MKFLSFKHLNSRVVSATIFCAFVFTSCEKDEQLTIPSERDSYQSESINDNPYTIPVEDALTNLNDFLSSFSDENCSRSNKNRIVKNIFSLEYKDCLPPQSRSEMDSLNCDKLVYIANFENDKGYAVLAADNRISTPVIALTDIGGICPDFDPKPKNPWEWDSEENRPIFAGYPRTGPGIFTLSEYPGQIFMNPNTVELRNVEKNDTLVGTYFFDNDIDSRSTNDNQNYDIENFTLGLCTSYAANEVISYGLKPNNPGWLPTDSMGDPTIPGLKHDITLKYIDTTQWIDKKRVLPIIFQSSKWGQESPFNDHHPKSLRAGIIVGSKRTAYAGCFTLAIAKLMVYFDKPNGGIIQNGYRVSYSAIKRDCYSFLNPDCRESLAYLLLNVCEGCKSTYFYQGTFTFPWDAISFMNKIGFRNVRKWRYTWDRTIDMLDKGKPVIVYAMPNYNVTQSHAWNIDGYKDMERTITIERYDNGNFDRLVYKTQTQQMVHCDYGYWGRSNGYYITGVFDRDSKDAILDPPGEKTKKYFNYNTYIHIVSYDL